MTKRSVFWLINSFLAVVDVVLLLFSPAIGLIFLLLVVLAVVLIALLNPRLWKQVKFKKKPKPEPEKAEPIGFRKMVLERNENDNMTAIVIDHSPFTIGRSQDCDFQVRNMPSVSKHHCKIVYRENTRNFYIEDLGSSNGTFVNSSRIAANVPQLVRSGYIIALDKYQFVLKQL